MPRFAISFLLLATITFGQKVTVRAAETPVRPNILWITSEDNGPHLGCYGDEYADTPNLDALAARSLRYRTCWSNAPVCAPARTTIITGVYPTSTGAEHMRSEVAMPSLLKMYPQFLREAGYYCTNNSKEDYNLKKPADLWDDSSGKAHWKNRKDGQPFFAIFNHTVSHESQLRKRPHTAVHDPAGVRVPAYHPDTPEVRQDWAQYYDKLTEMDSLVGRNLAELEDAGLADDTIIFYYGDHGSGMPRNKRWPYNSGLHVPLIVHIPEKFAHLRPDDYATGGVTDRLVSFVDLAPTLLSLTGIDIPEWIQGHAFAGPADAGPQPFVYGYRGRMDERYDLVRSVRDQRYVYIRQYMPHKVYGQYIAYMFQTPTTRVWRELFDAGKLTPEQSHFWQRKPAEELYDLHNDPDEVHNLAASPEYQEILKRLRTAQEELAVRIHDAGFLPEGEAHSRAATSTIYEMAHDPRQYNLPAIMEMAGRASSGSNSETKALISGLSHEDSGVRYWAATGLLIRSESALASGRSQLRSALQDDSPWVQIAAAQALAQYGNEGDGEAALPVLKKYASVTDNGVYLSMFALNAIDDLGNRARPLAGFLDALPRKAPSVPGRMGGYVDNLLSRTLSQLNREERR